jgi:hypothetical protein
MSHPQQQQQQGTGSSSKRPDPEEERSSLHQPGQPLPRYGDITYKDQVREAPGTTTTGTAAAGAAATGGGRAVADDVPIASAVAVSESRIQAEDQEDRLQNAEQRAAVAEAVQRDQQVRLAELERQLAAVLPPPPLPPSKRPPPQTGNLFKFGNEHEQPQQQTKNNDDSGGNSSTKHLSQRQRYCAVTLVVAVLIAVAGAAAGICRAGRCSSPKTSPVPGPVIPTQISLTAQQPILQPVLQPVPQPVPVSVLSMPITATARARADTILSYINGIILSGRTLTYPSSSSSAEERAIQWLVEVDSGTAVDDEQALRQRYVLGTLWFSQPTSSTTTGFGTANHAATWTTNIEECKWSDVACDGNGRLTALFLGVKNVRGPIPADLGLLTDLTYVSLYGNKLSGTIPSSLGALTALTRLILYDNLLVGTMPFCNSDHSIGMLVADCAKVSCTCCTECCPVAFGNIPVNPFCD